MKLFLKIVFLSVFCFPVMAQMNPNRSEKIEAARKTWIKQKLDFTSEEERVFWPVYDNYQAELEMLYREKRRAKANSGEVPFDEISFDTRMLEVRKKYRGEFFKILPKDKAMRVYQTEREFRDQLIRHLNKR